MSIIEAVRRRHPEDEAIVDMRSDPLQDMVAEANEGLIEI